MSGQPPPDRTAPLHAPLSDGGPPEVVLRVAVRSDPGVVRENNEDAFLVADLSPSTGGPAPGEGTEWVATVGRKGVLLAVSDGMGGHSAGEVASGLALATLKESLLAEWTGHFDRDAPAELRNDLRSAVDRANRAVVGDAEENPDRQGMGATLTAAVVLPDRLILAHVGDSRCYLLRDGFLKSLTADQSLAEELVRRGILDRDSSAYLARRNILTKVVGQKGRLEPDSGVVDLARGDRLLLCSDGLFGPVAEDRIREILEGAEEPAEAVAALVAEARGEGAPDNVTCLAAWLEGAGLPAPGDLDAAGATSSLVLDAASLASAEETVPLAEAREQDTGSYGSADLAGDDTLAAAAAEPAPPAGPPPASPAAAPPPPAEVAPRVLPPGAPSWMVYAVVVAIASLVVLSLVILK